MDNIRDLVPELAGVVEITIPSEVSQHIVSKSITKNTKMGVEIIGLVENMATYVCPHCNEEGALFEGQNVKELSSKKNIPFLGSIPFDTRISRKYESGKLFYGEFTDSPTAKAIDGVVDKILETIKRNSQQEGS